MLVSICMPAYNALGTICEAIDSVLGQTYNQWELVVVDDCSDDTTDKVIQSYCDSDSRVKLIRLDSNHGPAYCRDLAISKSSGTYIALLDSDDVWHPEKIRFQLEYLISNQYPICYHYYRKTDETMSKISDVIRGPGVLNYLNFIKKRGFGNCLTIMMEKRICPLPFFVRSDQQNNEINEDFLPLVNLLSGGYDVPVLDYALAYYRTSRNSRSNKKFKSALSIIKYYYSELGVPLYKAIFYLLNYMISGGLIYATVPKHHVINLFELDTFNR